MVLLASRIQGKDLDHLSVASIPVYIALLGGKGSRRIALLGRTISR